MKIMSNQNKVMSDCPETTCLLKESESDVIFFIEGQTLPALRQYLSVKSKVFKAMFSGDFKETMNSEVVIEDTTYEAFKTLVHFLYCDHLILSDANDLSLVLEVYKLSDRYDANRLMKKISKQLIRFELSFDSFEWISRIAFNYKNQELIDKVMDFIDSNFDQFMIKEMEDLNTLNEWTGGRLLKVMADNYLKVNFEWNVVSNELDVTKVKLAHLESKRCKSCNKINDSVPNFISPNCVYCGKLRSL